MEASDGAAVGEVGEPASLGGEILLAGVQRKMDGVVHKAACILVNGTQGPNL